VDLSACYAAELSGDVTLNQLSGHLSYRF
jgi:hypothetical protein